MMQRYAAYALAHPVFDPERQLGSDFHWSPERLVTAGLSCNIGME